MSTPRIPKTLVETYDWIINEKEDVIEVTFSFDITYNANSIVVEFANDNQDIAIHDNEWYPFLCGKLFQRVESFKTKIENQNFIVELKKTENVKWPIIITTNHSVNKGIDPKSAFLIYRLFSNSENEQEQVTGLSYLEYSASVFFVPSTRHYASLLLRSENTFPVAIKLMEILSESYEDGATTYHLALILMGNLVYIEQSISLLEKAALQGIPDALHTLGEIFSPCSTIEYDKKDPVRAREYLSSSLEKKESSIAYHELAKLYASGFGVEKNIDIAHEYQRKAVELDDQTPALPSYSESNEADTDIEIPAKFDVPIVKTSTKILRAALVSSFIIGCGYFIYKRLKKRVD